MAEQDAIDPSFQDAVDNIARDQKPYMRPEKEEEVNRRPIVPPQEIFQAAVSNGMPAKPPAPPAMDLQAALEIPQAHAPNGSRRLLDDIVSEQWNLDTTGYAWKYVNPNAGRTHKTAADTRFGMDPKRFGGDSVFATRSGGEVLFAYMPSPGGFIAEFIGKRKESFGRAPSFDMDDANATIELARVKGWDNVNLSGNLQAKEMLWMAVQRQNIQAVLESAQTGKPAKIMQTNFQAGPELKQQYEAMLNSLPTELRAAVKRAECMTNARNAQRHGDAELAQQWVQAAQGGAPAHDAPPTTPEQSRAIPKAEGQPQQQQVQQPVQQQQQQQRAQTVNETVADRPSSPVARTIHDANALRTDQMQKPPTEALAVSQFVRPEPKAPVAPTVVDQQKFQPAANKTNPGIGGPPKSGM